MSAPRFVPDEPLPRYAYVPGRSPHPVSDPAGHSYNAPRPRPAPPDPDDWAGCREYLYGIDLFNRGYYWEAHEVWEGLWKAAGRRGETADFLKGLIQLAVAGLKQRQGLPQVAQAHARRAAELWRGVAQERLLGFTVAALADLAEAAERDGWPAPPPVLLPS